MKELQAYEAAVNDIAYHVQPNVGLFRLNGSDRVDFLQRQTTNDLRLLTDENILSTVLTSPTARILDVFYVVDEGESLIVISLPRRASETLKFLRGRIFFSDRVSIDDLSNDFAQILLLGPRKDTLLEKMSLQPPALDQVSRFEVAGKTIAILVQKISNSLAYRLLVPLPSLEAILTELKSGGATPLNSDTFEILRVEAGRPGFANELSDNYTPLEVHLHNMISNSKGCYTGQEIIARQITYDKVTKNLVGVKLWAPAPVDAKIVVDGKSIGSLTSVVQSPRFGVIGLAVVRRQYREVGTKISILGKDDLSIEGEVVDLPFK